MSLLDGLGIKLHIVLSGEKKETRKTPQGKASGAKKNDHHDIKDNNDDNNDNHR